jgi:sulfide:quinone oxidoreductase
MADILVLGAGVSGHTAATFLRRWLGPEHTVTVVSPRANYNWIPSNIWVGVGKMTMEQVRFPLAPVYRKAGIRFLQAKATALWPEGSTDHERPFVEAEWTGTDRAGESERVAFDYLINATGPKLNFAATEGLGPDGHTVSVCSETHAVDAAAELEKCIAKMKAGERQKIVIGTGHGMCTCQGAAFEYIVNVEFLLRQRGVRDMADLVWISNEYELGDFGMGGIHLKRGGYITHSKVFTESLFAERGLDWLLRAHVSEVEEGLIHYETLDGERHTLDFDFAMLIPPFSGVGLQAFARDGEDITADVFAPNGFMKVDADYSSKPYERWRADDWPSHYRSAAFDNMYAVGIAFAPPHAISRPMKSRNGTPISPTPPRTGMPSAMIGKAVANTIADLVRGKSGSPHTACMSEMGAACVASAGASLWRGSAVSMTVYPVVPDFEKYPEYGRDIRHTFGEIGLAGHWIKHLLHVGFLYKAKLKPFWWVIPE